MRCNKRTSAEEKYISNAEENDPIVKIFTTTSFVFVSAGLSRSIQTLTQETQETD